jgi:hypothetical protein
MPIRQYFFPADTGNADGNGREETKERKREEEDEGARIRCIIVRHRVLIQKLRAANVPHVGDAADAADSPWCFDRQSLAG